MLNYCLMFQKFSNLKLPATNGSAELGVSFLKFGLSQKLTKLKKNLPHGFDKSADLLKG